MSSTVCQAGLGLVGLASTQCSPDVAHPCLFAFAGKGQERGPHRARRPQPAGPAGGLAPAAPPGAEHGIIQKHRQHQRHPQAQWGARALTTARGRAKRQGFRMVQSVTCALLLHDPWCPYHPLHLATVRCAFALWPPPFLSGSLCGQDCPIIVTLLIPVLRPTLCSSHSTHPPSLLPGPLCCQGCSGPDQGRPVQVLLLQLQVHGGRRSACVDYAHGEDGRGASVGHMIGSAQVCGAYWGISPMRVCVCAAALAGLHRRGRL